MRCFERGEGGGCMSWQRWGGEWLYPESQRHCNEEKGRLEWWRGRGEYANERPFWKASVVVVEVVLLLLLELRLMLMLVSGGGKFVIVIV